jgi:4-amino-4-deoxy-L-arabinose transferase-like glycosyltransferase
MTTSVLFRQRLECVLFAALVLISRLLFRSQLLYDLDSVNFALGVSRFDPTVHQPHPPGYFLYVCLGRLVSSIVHDPNTALVAISIAASCGAVVMIYLLAFEWFGPDAARFAALLFLFSPLTWFHGIVGLVYIVEAFLSALAGYFCWQVYIGRKSFAIPAALVLGLGAGIRPSFPVFLAPLFLFSLWGISWKRIGAVIGLALLAALAWFVPMVEVSGGLPTYLGALAALWHTEGGHHTIFNSSPATSAARILAISLTFAACFGPAILLFARALYRKQSAHVGQSLGLRRPDTAPFCLGGAGRGPWGVAQWFCGALPGGLWLSLRRSGPWVPAAGQGPAPQQHALNPDRQVGSLPRAVIRTSSPGSG